MTLNEHQRDRLARLREATADKPAHAEFLAVLEDAAPGEILDDIELPRGVSRRAADALIEDFEWITAPEPEPGMYVAQYPGAYRALRFMQARAAVWARDTRDSNATWAGFSFGGK